MLVSEGVEARTTKQKERPHLNVSIYTFTFLVVLEFSTFQIQENFKRNAIFSILY